LTFNEVEGKVIPGSSATVTVFIYLFILFIYEFTMPPVP
jgi:hypothetical protein